MDYRISSSNGDNFEVAFHLDKYKLYYNPKNRNQSRHIVALFFYGFHTDITNQRSPSSQPAYLLNNTAALSNDYLIKCRS